MSHTSDGGWRSIGRDVAEILKHSYTEIIAASVKFRKGLPHHLLPACVRLTLPYEVLTGLITHPLSEKTVAEFQANGIGIIA